MRSALSAGSRSMQGSIFAKAFGLAVLAWIISGIGWFLWMITPEGDLGLMAVALPFLAAHAGFMGGLLALVAAGAFALIRRRSAFPAIGLALLVYVLPLPIWTIIAVGALSLTPASAGSSDMVGLSTGISAPIALLCGCVGSLTAWANRASLQNAALGAALPSMICILLGTVALAGFVGSSAEFRHRGSIQVEIDRVHVSRPGLEVELTVDMRKGGPFRFHALYLQFAGGSSGARADAIVWEGGSPPSGPGRYRAKLLWNAVPLNRRVEKRVLFLKIYEGAGREKQIAADLRLDLTDEIAAELAGSS